MGLIVGSRCTEVVLEDDLFISVGWEFASHQTKMTMSPAGASPAATGLTTKVFQTTKAKMRSYYTYETTSPICPYEQTHRNVHLSQYYLLLT